MRIFFTTHANRRLVRRKISLKEVYRTLKSPDYIKPGYEDRILIGKKFGGNTIEIVCIKKLDKIIIITIYFKWK